jgi:hypothetical protein
MQQENLYNELYTKLSWEPDKLISGSFALISDYDYEQYILDNTRVPLATSNCSWDELCEVYSEEQIRLMVSIILDKRKSKVTLTDKLIDMALTKSHLMTTRQRRQRSDNSEFVAKTMMLDKEKIIQSLLLHQDILYNPVVIWIWKETHCSSILKFDSGFIDRHKFMDKQYLWTSRHVAWAIINIPKLKELWYPMIDRKDILDVDLRHYTLTMWLLIQDNNFNRLPERWKNYDTQRPVEISEEQSLHLKTESQATL